MSAVGALDGIKVVDLSVMISGPLAGMMLADQGADVIKVESPGLGDIMRFLGSSKGGVTGIFLNNNRGKRSLVLDLKKPEGLDVLKRLISEADVLIQNFRPGAMERLGLGYEDAAKLNPNLIYTSISGYGPDGPFSHRRVYDNVIQAGSGLASVQTDPGTGMPSMYRTLVCDKTTAYTAAHAITSALFARATGKAAGQHVVVSMLDAAIAFMWPDSAMDAVLLDDDVKRSPTIGSNYAVTELADGYVSAGAVSDAEFKGLVAALGHPEMGEDPRFATAQSRMGNLMELVTLMRQYASETTVDVFLARCEEFDVPASAILKLEEVADDPQVKHNQIFVERDHPVAGRVREPRPAARMSATPQRVSDPAPLFGQHSDEIVQELGLDAAALREAGVIH
ncbi:MAG: CoA transferase [Gammaproteobacteria bacterium]|nr:CoA transferase [Gammaproteobacteria bacterium]